MITGDRTCNYCEKLVMIVESGEPIGRLFDLPNTFDPDSGVYRWRYYEILAYTLVPRSIEDRSGHVDLYFCIDENDLDDIDLAGYANRFVREVIMPQWKIVSNFYLLEPTLSPPAENMDCRRARFLRTDWAPSS